MTERIKKLGSDGKVYVWDPSTQRWSVESTIADLVAPTEPTLSDSDRRAAQAEADRYGRTRQDWPATLDALRDIELKGKAADKEMDSKLHKIKSLLKQQWSIAQSEKIHSPESLRKEEKNMFLRRLGILKRRKRRGVLP
jgi:hypothetical protein